MLEDGEEDCILHAITIVYPRSMQITIYLLNNCSVLEDMRLEGQEMAARPVRV